MNKYEKENLVVALRRQGKNYRDISKLAQISIRDIKPILDKYGTDTLGLDSDRSNYPHDSDSDDSPKVVAISSRAYKLFSEGQSPLEVSMALNIGGPKVLSLYKEYQDMKHMSSFSRMYEEVGDDLPELIEFYEEAKRDGINKNHRTFRFDLPAVQKQYEALKIQTDAVQLECSATRN